MYIISCSKKEYAVNFLKGMPMRGTMTDTRCHKALLEYCYILE